MEEREEKEIRFKILKQNSDKCALLNFCEGNRFAPLASSIFLYDIINVFQPLNTIHFIKADYFGRLKRQCNSL